MDAVVARVTVVQKTFIMTPYPVQTRLQLKILMTGPHQNYTINITVSLSAGGGGGQAIDGRSGKNRGN